MPSHHDYGIDCETFCGGTPDDYEPLDYCPTCGCRDCVGYCEQEDMEPPPGPPPYTPCVVCGINGVDPLNGEDTCAECIHQNRV
jgi:hypothetical protein